MNEPRWVEPLLRSFAAVPLLITLLLLGVMGVGVINLLGDIRLFTDLGPLLVGTALTTGVALVVAVPTGLMAAIYLAEFATDGLRRWLKPALELLAGVPTLVYGYIALVVITPWLQRVMAGVEANNALAAGLAMALMILPTVASLSEDAIRAVPRGLREAALALGGSRLRMLRQIVLPNAISGIVAAVVLAVSRALGETMIVTLAAGHQARVVFDPRLAVETVTGRIAEVSLNGVKSGSDLNTILGLGAALFAVTLMINLIGGYLVRRLQRAPS